MLKIAKLFTKLRPDSKGRSTSHIKRDYRKILGIDGFAQRNIRLLPSKKIPQIISWLEGLN